MWTDSCSAQTEQCLQCVFLGLVSAVRNISNVFFLGYCPLCTTSVMCFSRVIVRCAQHRQYVFLGLVSAVRGAHTFFVRTAPPAPERSEENVGKKSFLFYLSTVRGALTFLYKQKSMQKELPHGRPLAKNWS
jgi:hypothetical protein